MPSVHAYDRQRRHRRRHKCIEIEERPKRSIASGAFSSQRRKARWPKTALPILSHVMLLGVDPLEGVLDAKLFVRILELFTADQFPRATIGGLEAAVVHAVVVEDDLHATATTDDLVCLIERLLESDTLELDGIVESLSHGVSLPRG